MDFNPMAALGEERTVECLACGTASPMTAGTCTECGAELRDEDDDEARLDVTSGPASAADPRKNFAKLRQAVDGVTQGTLDTAGYRKLVEEVYQVAFLAVELFKTDVVKNKMKTMTPEERDLSQRTADLFGHYLAGVTRMKDYYKTGDPQDALVGFRVVEETFRSLEQVKSEADAMEARYQASRQG